MRFPTRTAAVISAAALATLGSLAPISAQPSQSGQPSQPGQPSSQTAQPAQPQTAGATPPALPPNFPVPTDSGKPDLTYTQQKNCVSSQDAGVVLHNKPWGQLQLDFDTLHKFATGKDQTVVVIDTGVYPHKFFGGRLAPGGDYVDANDKGLKDCDGHGTEVAGIIAANPPPGGDIGFQGIAPDARIVSIRQSSGYYTGKDPNNPDAGDKQAGNLSTLAQAIRRAADTAPHGVINMSVDNCRPAGAGGINDTERQVQAALRYAVEVRDVVPVASAGNLGQDSCPNQNNGPDVSRPASIVIPPWFSDYVLSVAAMDSNGDPAKFSVQGPWVSVAAPGTDIISLDPGNINNGLANRVVVNGNQSPIQGTSFAAPYVSGLAALVRDRYRNLNAKQVMNRIKMTASHPAATGGHDSLVGYGMINPVAAVTAMIPAEQNIAPDKAITIPFTSPPPASRDWTPTTVALLGSLGGVGLLLLTLFVVHTVRRNRKEPETPRPDY
jgi:membrane-anchored mycosin MYCP